MRLRLYLVALLACVVRSALVQDADRLDGSMAPTAVGRRAMEKAHKREAAAFGTGMEKGAQLLADAQLAGIVQTETKAEEAKAAKAAGVANAKRLREEKIEAKQEAEDEHQKVVLAEERDTKTWKSMSQVKADKTSHEEQALKLELKVLRSKKEKQHDTVKQDLEKLQKEHDDKKQKALDEQQALQKNLLKMKQEEAPVVEKMTAQVKKNIDDKILKESNAAEEKRSEDNAAEKALKAEMSQLQKQRAKKETALSKAKESLASVLHDKFGSNAHLSDVLEKMDTPH